MSELNEIRAKHFALIESVKLVIEAWEEASIQGTGDFNFGLRCGLEDKSIVDRYESMEYGYESALERFDDEIMDILRTAIGESEVRDSV